MFEMFATHGQQATLLSHNGCDFTSSEFNEFMKMNGIRHMKVALYHPSCMDLKRRLWEVGGWQCPTKLSQFLLSYYTTPHSMTRVPPAGLLMKRRLHTQLNKPVPSVEDRIRNKQSQQKAAYD